MSFSRRLIAGSSQVMIGNGAVRLLAFVTMPILTGLLSPQAYGIAALVGTTIALLSVLALAGIDVSYVRSYRSNSPPNGADAEQYCWRFAVGSSTLVAALGAAAWFAAATWSSTLDQGYAFLIALGVVLATLCTMVQARARLNGRYRAIALAVAVSGVIGAVTSIAIAFWWRRDALALVLPLMLGYLMLILLLHTPPLAGLAKPSRLTAGAYIPLVKTGLAAVVTAPAYWVLSSSDRWFIQYYHGAEAVGVYSIGYVVAVIGAMVNAALLAVWLPEAASEYERDSEQAKVILGRTTSRVIVLLALIWLVVTSAGGDIIRWIANERFHASADFVPLIAGGVFFYGISQLALYGLVLVRQFEWAAYWWIAGGLLCVVLNSWLVSLYGGIGAALTQCGSFAFVAIGILATSQAKYRVVLDWRRLTYVITLIFVTGIYLSPAWNASAMLSLLMKLPLGVAVAAIVSLSIAQEFRSQRAG